MMAKRKICVVTGTRAEYGLLYWLMKEIQQDEELKLQIVATGMHLSPAFGLTYRTIEADGFLIDEKIEMLLSSDTAVGIAKSVGLGVIGFADALERLKPDILVLLGDRFEILSAAQAALVMNIPVAHLHGGELTEGAIDDAIRHSITKMAQLHFVSEEPYRQRVVQLGEQPDCVFNFGALAVDSMANLEFMPLDELEKSIGFPLGAKFLLVTFHPLTIEAGEIKSAMQELLQALHQFADYKILFTKPNADKGNHNIGQMIDAYVRDFPKRAFAVVSLGQRRYLSAMKWCAAVVGNSSSGILEAPLLMKPTVNIGDRQKGRVRATSVIDCNADSDQIIQSIYKAVSLEFEDKIYHMKQYKRAGTVAGHIKKVLKQADLKQICRKRFYDL